MPAAAILPIEKTSRQRARAAAATAAKTAPNRLPTLLTVDDVGAVLRLSRTAVYAMIERGQLPGVVRIGRRVRIREEALLHFLRQSAMPSLERAGQR